jgi:hypothetical protein
LRLYLSWRMLRRLRSSVPKSPWVDFPSEGMIMIFEDWGLVGG